MIRLAVALVAVWAGVTAIAYTVMLIGSRHQSSPDSPCQATAVEPATDVLPAPSPAPAPSFMSRRDATEYARRCEVARLECMFNHPAYRGRRVEP